MESVGIPYVMWGVVRDKHELPASIKVCKVCKGQGESLVHRRVYACDSCLSFYCPQIDFRKETLWLKGCDCCYSKDLSTYAMWMSFCIRCTLEQAKKLKFREETFGSQLSFLQVFNPSPLSGDFTGDLSLFVEGREVMKAHEFILGSKSIVFKKMMEVDTKEKAKREIHLVSYSADVVRAVVNCMYTSEIDFNKEVTPLEVLRFCHQYEILWLKNLCEEELVKVIADTNLVSLLSISHMYEAEKLKAAVKKFFSAGNAILQGNVLDDLVCRPWKSRKLAGAE